MKTLTLIMGTLNIMFLNAQNKLMNNYWIRNDYVQSIEKKNDTTHIDSYITPILGISNPFNNNFSIMCGHCDQKKIPLNNYQVINKNTIKIDSHIGGFLGGDTFLDKYKVKNDNYLSGLLIMKDDILTLKLFYKKKQFVEYNYTNHYNDYYFKDLREAYGYLNKIKRAK